MNPLFASSTEHRLHTACENSQLEMIKVLGIESDQASFESIDKRINQIKNDVLSNNLEDAFKLLSQMQTSSEFFKNIAKPLSKENDKEKQIHQLLFTCRGVKKLPSAAVENLMNELIELLPYFTYDQTLQFTDHFLPELLEYSKELIKSQCDLACALSQVFVNYAIKQSLPIHHVFWRLGMGYFAKSLTIAIEKNLDAEYYHQKIQHLILNLALRSPLFDEQKNAIPGDPEKFEKLILATDKLTRFCSSPSDRVFIKECYLKTLKLHNTIPFDKAALFTQCHHLLDARLKDQIPFSTFSSKRYRDKLMAMRKQFPASGLRKAQHEGTKFLRNFLAMMIDDAIAIVGPTPCEYDFRALGSIAKDEGCPYSDLESMILIQDEKYRPYFQHLSRVLELLIISLDESPTLKDISSVFTCLPGRPKLGLHLDKGANPATAEELIRTPENMANHQVCPLNDEFITSWDHATRKSISLHGNNTALFHDFMRHVAAIAGERKNKGLALLRTRLKDFKERWGSHQVFPVEIDLKEHFIQLIQHLFCDLSIYFGIQAGNSLDIIDRLTQVFDSESRAMLKDVVEQLHAMRIRLHQIYGDSKTLMSFQHKKSTRNVYVASDKERKLLEVIYLLVLKPLYHILSDILEAKPNHIFAKMTNWWSKNVENDSDILLHKKFEHSFKEINIKFFFPSFESNELSDQQMKSVVKYTARILLQLNGNKSIKEGDFLYTLFIYLMASEIKEF